MESFQYDVCQGALIVRGELTIYQIGEALEALRSALKNGQLETLDLAEVTEIDTAGLQWLLMARKRAPQVRLVNCSEPVAEIFALAGCGHSPSAEHEAGKAL